MFVLNVEAASLPGDAPFVLRKPTQIVTPIEPFLWRLLNLLGAEVDSNTKRAPDVIHLALTALQLVKPALPAPLADKRILAVAHDPQETSVAEMARRSGLGQSQFHALFRATTGQSPKQLQLRKLLDRAVDRLVTTSDPIAEIAFELGYQNVSSFNRLFRQRFGVTPSEFRTSRRNFG
jgi:AraC-like DNA-binding protein